MAAKTAVENLLNNLAVVEEKWAGAAEGSETPVSRVIFNEVKKCEVVAGEGGPPGVEEGL